MKTVFDTLGGDKGCANVVRGALRSLDKHDDLSVVFVGDENEINGVLKEEGRLGDSRIEVVHAPEVVTGEDRPTDAIRLKKDSSMIRSISILRTDESVNALVSTGATGTLTAAATLRIGRIRGIRRPALCPILPTMNGGIVGICDSGANVDVTPEMLLQFACLGSVYLETAFGIERPRVALLNVGTESEKGDGLRKAAYPLLKEEKTINFVGNMESRDLLSGKYDLIVCDGFSGNVLAKSTEGAAMLLLKRIKSDIMKKTKYKVGAMFLKKMFMEEKEFMNYQNYGGSVLLGCEKIIVKGHGSSNEKAVEVCSEQAYRMYKNGLLDKVSERAESYLALEEEK